MKFNDQQGINNKIFLLLGLFSVPNPAKPAHASGHPSGPIMQLCLNVRINDVRAMGMALPAFPDAAAAAFRVPSPPKPYTVVMHAQMAGAGDEC